jgi:hypothetical protein
MLSLARIARLCVVAAGALAFAAGCNTGPRSSVEGTVSYDGQPVGLGSIAFHPLNEDGGPSGAPGVGGPIREGQYHLEGQRAPLPGKCRVEIRWQKKTGKKVPGEGGQPRDETVPVIPAKYNTESELTVEVVPGRNTFSFDLKK